MRENVREHDGECNGGARSVRAKELEGEREGA